MSALYIDNDNLITLSGLQNAATDEYVNDATVTVTLVDDAGNEVSGQTWPETMQYVAGTDGEYRATLEHTLDVEVGQNYFGIVEVDAGSGLMATFRKRLEGEERNA